MYIIYLLILINLFAFVLVVIDKNKSRMRGEWRVPEVYFFVLASFFGSAGVFVGLLLSRHKVSKPYFFFGIISILVQQALLVYLILH